MDRQIPPCHHTIRRQQNHSKTLEPPSENPNFVLQVAPYWIGERRPFDMPVILLTLADRSVLSYAESQAQGYLDRESTTVLPMLTAYHQLQAASLSQDASVAMINQLRKGTP